MSTVDKLKDIALNLIDGAQACLPRRRPPLGLYRNSRLVAHRGAHNNYRGPAKENTILAFDKAVAAGAWGIEFDVRWSSDDIPLVHHDTNTRRVFGRDLELRQTSFVDIRRWLPEIPTLDEVVERYLGRSHLMVELKADRSTNMKLSNVQLDRLENALRPLRAGDDFHIMGIEPSLLLQCEFAPRATCLPIAEVNCAEISQIALKEGLGGMAGPYALIQSSHIKKHHEVGQKIGTGFISSRSVLYREINRGVDWLFSNHCIEMATFIQSAMLT